MKGKSKARAAGSAKAISLKAADLPMPFVKASQTLAPFLSKLDKSHVYITHIDSKPQDFKRKIFLVPVIMNVAIVGLLLWRIKHIGPYYMSICFSLMGKPNETTINTALVPMNDVLKELLRRAWIFALDFMIYVFVWPWPKAFFFGRTIGNPVQWRLAVGFREKEIIVRRSRKWDHTIGNVLEEGSGQDTFFDVVKRAVEPIWMNEKTGYLMLNNEWDLDWRLIIIATKLVDKKSLVLEDFKTTILLHSEEFGWLEMEMAGAGGSVKEEEGRRKIVAFKDELTALGKESLFFRWIELVQFESSQPGGFGPEQQQKTMEKAQAMFESQGIDFDKFWEKVGGMNGMPGMDPV